MPIILKKPFRRTSSASAASAPGDDPSASYHRNKNAAAPPAGTTPARRPGSARRKSSLWRRSFGSEASADDFSAVDPAASDLAVREAERERSDFRESLPKSLVEAHDGRDCVAPFRGEEIVLGRKLGSGEFSNVYPVQSFELDPRLDGDASLSAEEAERRLHMKSTEKYRDTEKVRYALKHLKEEYYELNGSEAYVQAAADVALEAEFLASLQHPNIIKLRGITHSGAAGFADGPSGFFLVIDCLVETLDQKIKKWHKRRNRIRPMSASVPNISSIRNLSKAPKADGKRGVLDECLSVGLQISAAMVYMHKNSIIFRDLKPANVGFDVRGDVKIFDFGLARIVPQDGNPNYDQFDMSGAGSPRYMAPECLAGLPYNLKADVYTFSIVLWEILTGITPYGFVKNRAQLLYYIIKENGRPDIDGSWPSPVQGMLESSFDADMLRRPKMSLWYNMIRKTLAALRGGDMRGLNHTHISRRRTMESTRNLMSMVNMETGGLERAQMPRHAQSMAHLDD